MKLHKTAAAAETIALAESAAKTAVPGGVYALTGPLGAGKTVFARGFARGLGYKGNTSSPTFTLMNVYEGGRLTLYHFDLYRLPESGAGLEDIGFEDYLYAGGVCLIEWAERAETLMPETAVWVKFKLGGGADGEQRVIEII